MNDLFSNSFKKYQDLKKQNEVDDLEGGQDGQPGTESIDLAKFFEDVENVKEDMKDVEKFHKKLQESNEESKLVHNAKTVKEIRSRMDSDVSQVLKRVKMIKGKLEALERSNAAHRKISGCGPGSSADRTRTSVVSGLGKKLKVLMDDFQGLRTRMNDEYKETVARRYFTVTGEKADDGLIENLISSGESESFLQKAIQEQGRGQIMDTISEIQERHDAVKEIEKNLIELHQIFLDMAALVEAQGQQLNDIESHVAHASSFVRRGTEQLQEAREIQKSSRKCACFAVFLIILLIILLTFPLWWPLVASKIYDDSIELQINSPEVKRLREDLLDDLYDSEFCTPNLDLDSFMKSFENEITASETAGVSSESGESQPELGYLLEASDDELGLPPPTEAEPESVRVCTDSLSNEFWGLEDQIPSYDPFDLGIVESDHYIGNNINMGEYVGLDGLFDHSDIGYGSGDFLWRPETLPAQ